MKRNLHTPQDLNFLNKLFQHITSLPEFSFTQGDFLARLEYVCYYHLGNFKYPPKQLLTAWLAQLAGQFDIKIVVQDIQLKIIHAPVYKIAGQAAIMAQDINHVIGPVDELLVEDAKDLPKAIEKTLLLLQDFQPHQLGDILLSSPPWCKAKYLIEAVIYHFDASEITSEKIVRAVLTDCFKKTHSLKVHSLALEPLGTEYQVLSYRLFVQILHETLLQLAGQLPHLKELTVAARNPNEAKSLKQAFSEVLNIKIP